MPRTIKVATVQMDAAPSPLNERLERAEKIVVQAANAGSQLVILPELFNIGYAYTDDNFQRAELMDGVTSTWMKNTSARLGIHLAGTFLLLERGEIYDTMLLFSPSGQTWRYDKNYPWAWERGYFRGRRGMTIANTELGDLGLMICWDLGHLKLWQQYAGKADMIVIASCPPDAPNGSFEFPNGEKVNFGNLGAATSSVLDAGKQFFGEMVNQQAKWLGIPAVNSGASGVVQTPIPKANSLIRSMVIFAPSMVKLLTKAGSLQLTCQMIPSCKIMDADGQVVAERNPTEGEGYIMAEVNIADLKSMPTRPQPNPPLEWMATQMSIINADVVIPSLVKSIYKNGVKALKK